MSFIGAAERISDRASLATGAASRHRSFALVYPLLAGTPTRLLR